MDLVAHNRAAYNKIAAHFSATRHNLLWPELNEFTSFLAPGQRVLDWGCGNGRLLAILKERELEYIGVDISVELLKQAEKLNAEAVKSGKVRFICSENGEPNFPPNHFDNVFMIASFFHLPDEASRLKLLNKTYQELKPGGHLFMTLWNLESDWANEKKSGWTKLAENDHLIPWKNPEGKVEAERYYHHFTETEITELLKQNNFSIERIGLAKDVGTFGRNLIVIAKK